MPNIVPNMGVDYATLARLTNNTGIVPGGNPAGNIGTAGQAGYLGDQQRQHEEMMRQATSLAALDAQLKAQQADEYSAGAPGRMANIQTDNALSQGKLGMLPELLRKQQFDATTGVNESGAKAIQSKLDVFVPYANEWAQADTKEEKDDIRKRMKSEGIIDPNRIDMLTDTQLDAFMKRVRGASINTPAQVGKERIETIKGEYGVNKAKLAADARIKASSRAAEIRAEMQRQKLSEDEMRHPNEHIFKLLMKEAGDDPIQIQAASNWYQSAQINVAAARAGSAPQQTDFNPTTGAITTRPPVVPKPITPPITPKAQASQSDISKYHQYIQQAGGDKKKIDFINSQWQAKFGELPK